MRVNIFVLDTNFNTKELVTNSSTSVSKIFREKSYM